MFFVKTENVDKLCVPFGIIIGPCTVLSNTVKLVGDVIKIVFNGLLTLNYTSSQAYTTFKAAELAWEQNVSKKYKPQLSNEGGFSIAMHAFADPEYQRIIGTALGTPNLVNYSHAYDALSNQDKRQVAFEKATQASIQHLSFIGVGIIRSIPLAGGVARWVYNVKTQAASP